jgi:hypothetical protein
MNYFVKLASLLDIAYVCHRTHLYEQVVEGSGRVVCCPLNSYRKLPSHLLPHTFLVCLQRKPACTVRYTAAVQMNTDQIPTIYWI